MYQLGWLSTGRDKAARDLLEVAWNSIQRGEIKAEIAFVFCTREPGEAPESDLFIKQVEDYGIPLICHSYQRFRARSSSYLDSLDSCCLVRISSISPYSTACSGLR